MCKWLEAYIQRTAKPWTGGLNDWGSNVRLVTDWRECYDFTRSLLVGPDPVFLSRIGGSDTNALVSYLHDRVTGSSSAAANVQRHRAIVERFNGYYDSEPVSDSYEQYLATLLNIYESSDYLSFCNHQLLSLYFRANIHESFYHDTFEDKAGFINLIERLGAMRSNLTCFPYPFVEKLVSHPLTLFAAFRDALVGRRVLVVSPFTASIKQNFGHRQRFFKNYDYPEFELKLLNTPITYAGLPPSLYPHRNWHETTADLNEQVGRIDFDVALLSCGSYALPIGNHIANVLGRKAVYVGGVLQLYFGIMGRRYENPFFTDQINVDAYINPIEKEIFRSHIDFAGGGPAEAFAAYF